MGIQRLHPEGQSEQEGSYFPSYEITRLGQPTITVLVFNNETRGWN